MEDITYINLWIWSSAEIAATWIVLYRMKYTWVYVLSRRLREEHFADFEEELRSFEKRLETSRDSLHDSRLLRTTQTLLAISNYDAGGTFLRESSVSS